MPAIHPHALASLSANTGMSEGEIRTIVALLDKTPQKGEAFVEAVNFFAGEEVARLPEAMRGQLDNIAADMLLLLKTKMIDIPKAQQEVNSSKTGGLFKMGLGAALAAGAVVAVSAFVVPLGAALIPAAAIAGALGLYGGNRLAKSATQDKQAKLDELNGRMAQLQEDYTAQQASYTQASQHYLGNLRSQVEALQHVDQERFSDRFKPKAQQSHTQAVETGRTGAKPALA